LLADFASYFFKYLLRKGELGGGTVHEPSLALHFCNFLLLAVAVAGGAAQSPSIVLFAAHSGPEEGINLLEARLQVPLLLFDLPNFRAPGVLFHGVLLPNKKKKKKKKKREKRKKHAYTHITGIETLTPGPPIETPELSPREGINLLEASLQLLLVFFYLAEFGAPAFQLHPELRSPRTLGWSELRGGRRHL
jgi:hypothetical protein